MCRTVWQFGEEDRAVMLISPHMDSAVDFTPQVDFAPQTYFAELSGVEPYDPKIDDAQNRPEDREGFAEILAGLLKTGTGEAESAAGAEGMDSVLPLADELEVPAALLADARASAPKNGLRVETFEVETEAKAAGGPKKAEKNDKEFAELEFSGEEQNFLLMVERLLNRPAENVSPDEEAYLAGEIHVDDAVSLDGSAVSFRVPVENALAALDPTEAAQMLDEAAAALARAGFGENLPPEAENAANAKNLAAGAKNVRFDGAGFDAEPEQLLAAAKAGGNGRLPEPAAPQKNAAAEKDGRGRLEESRSRDKRRGFSVEVQDFRNAQSGGAAKADAVQARAGLETGPLHENGSHEITLELHLPNQGRDAPITETAANAAWETRAGQAVEDMLARELHQNFNNDIVRHASMALHDGGAGTIKLSLKPETLGNVKIRLEMAENKITGHIVVESEEALRAFERELHSLEQAFMESGFEAANLQMSLAADGRGAGQFWQEAEASRFLTSEAAASRYDAALERAEPVSVDVYQRNAAVNMLA